MEKRPEYSQPYRKPPIDENGLIRLWTDEELQRFKEQDKAGKAEHREKLQRWHVDRYREQTIEKWRGRMKKAIAVVALVGAAKSGGYIDMAADPFSDAGHVAESAIEVEPVTIPDEMDGIAFSDYPLDTQAEYIANEENRVETQKKVRETVVRLFERADKEGYDEIVSEAKAEKDAHPELYQTQEAIDEAKNAIDESDSNEQALLVLSGFMRAYNIDAKFYDEEKFEGKQGQAKDILKAYIDVFSVLPKDFIALSEVEHLTISAESINHEPGGLPDAATYSYDSHTMNVVVPGISRYSRELDGFLTGNDQSYRSTIAHELGHAFDDSLPIGSYIEKDDRVDMTEHTPLPPFITQAVRYALKRTKYMSVYGRTGPEENAAEIISGLTSDRSDGLATTEEARRFGSESNKSMIDMLAQLEEQRPGIAKILITNRMSD